MRTAPFVTVGLVALTLLSGGWHAAEAQGSSDLAGGWIVTSWTSSEGVVDDTPQRGLFVFTAAGHYSMMYVLGDEPRPTYSGDTMTEAETLAAYESFVANSGRYSVDGNRLSYEAYMAKDPNYMAEFSAQDRTNAVNVEWRISDGILTLRWLDGFAEGQTATFRRPGQPQGG